MRHCYALGVYLVTFKFTNKYEGYNMTKILDTYIHIYMYHLLIGGLFWCQGVTIGGH